MSEHQARHLFHITSMRLSDQVFVSHFSVIRKVEETLSPGPTIQESLVLDCRLSTKHACPSNKGMNCQCFSSLVPLLGMENKILASQWPLSLVMRKTKMSQRRWPALWRGWHPTTTQGLPPMRRAHTFPPVLFPTAVVLSRYWIIHCVIHMTK